MPEAQGHELERPPRHRDWHSDGTGPGEDDDNRRTRGQPVKVTGRWMVTALGEGPRRQHFVPPGSEQWHDADGWPMGWYARGAARERWRRVLNFGTGSRSARPAPGHVTAECAIFRSCPATARKRNEGNVDMFEPPDSVIMQPGTACNLDCSYCYLPFRRQHLVMSADVADAVARSVRPWTERRTVEVCWHGGEPLAVGRAHLGRLMDCFRDLDVAHGIQTNAMLISDAWCEFFAEYDVHVGVSIDGPPGDNAPRVDLQGRLAFARIMAGIEKLGEYGHDVSIISVVSDPSPERARRLYNFAVTVGAFSLGVNVEEQEGVNAASNAHDSEQVVSFWAELVRAWQANPVVRVREIDRALGYVGTVLSRDEDRSRPGVDPLPTVAYDGSVTLISPELAGFHSPRFGDFACGNVLGAPLNELIRRGVHSAWVTEFVRGVHACRDICSYFDFCGGGHPANRYFEEGRLDGTETNYCRNSKIGLMEGVLRVAGSNHEVGMSDTLACG